jgi:hypothetical protein
MGVVMLDKIIVAVEAVFDKYRGCTFNIPAFISFVSREASTTEDLSNDIIPYVKDHSELYTIRNNQVYRNSDHIFDCDVEDDESTEGEP